MRSLFLWLMAAALLLACASQPTKIEPRSREQRAAALDGLQLTDLRGQPIALHHEVLLINFWATFCQPCKEKMPWLEQLHQRYRGRGLRLINISLDPPETQELARSFIDEKKYSFTVCFDDQERAAATYNPRRQLPLLLLFDYTGRQVAEKSALTSADQVLLEQRIEVLLLSLQESSQGLSEPRD